MLDVGVRVNPWCPTAWFNPKPTSLRTSPHPPPPIFDPTAPRADYKERHSAYVKSIEQVADTHHLVKTPEFRQPAHFYWLAGYHVRGWSQNIIAEAADVRRFAVQYAINTLSARLGLTPRADRPKALRGPEHDSQRDEIARLLSEVS